MARELDFENLFSMVENIITGVGVFELENEKLTPIYLNEGCFRMLGYPRTEGMKYVKNMLATILVEDRETFWQGIHDILKDDGVVEFEFRTVTAQGALRWLQVRGNLYSREGDRYILVGVIIDATERKNVEAELQEQAERLNILSQSGGELIFDYNAKTDVMTIKANHKRGFYQDIIIEKYMAEFRCSNIYEEDLERYYEVMHGALKSAKRDSLDVRANYMQEDGFIWYRVDLTSMTGIEGYVTRIIGRMTDIHEKKLKELELEIRAEKDSMTKLYNKGATRQLIEQVLAEEETANQIHALMIVDLDNFKQVNDLFGHAKGDEVIQYAAEQMTNTFKRRDIIGRVGGDEFVVFITDISMITNADLLAMRLCKLLDQRVECDGQCVRVTSSIGIAVAPYHGKTYDELFQKADKALYSAKANGKNGYRIFDGVATITYHSSREASYHPDEQSDVRRDLIDKVFQILFEDRNRSSAIRSVLELLAEHYGMQRGYMDSAELERKFPEENLQFSVSGYEIGRETEKSRQDKWNVLKECFEKYGSFAVIHNYDDISDEVRAFMQQRGIRMMILQAVTLEGGYIGSIVLESHNGETEPDKEQLDELRCIFRILNMYALEPNEKEGVRNNIARIEMLDNFDSYAYAVDADTYRFYFLNKKALLSMPNVQIGDLCYKALQGRESPCEDCIMHKLDRKKQHDSISEEYFNYALRVWTRNMASWLECRSEHPICLMNCVDISEYFIG
ncbi:MAG: diguanylate cyclase [Lachnospiraceae bacterium]|nr:diguanylate cyclase [Lachnospiraceae bacterium]